MADADKTVALAREITTAIFQQRETLQKQGRTFTAGDMVATVAGILVHYRIAPRKPPQPAGQSKAAAATDDAWLDSLQAEPAYRGIDIRRELSKCATWCQVNRKTMSRRRFVNWLNKTEPPLSPGGPRGAARSIYVEPVDWHSTLQRVGRAFDPEKLAELAAMKWADLPISVRDLILKG